MRIVDWFEHNPVLVAGVPLLLLAAALLYSEVRRDEPRGVEFAYASLISDGEPIRVQVDGAVANPGVYDLREGDRLVDAIASAGGPAADADIEGLNLARRVRDEERVTIPRTSASQAGRILPLFGSGLPLDGKVNINTASAKDLDALPGIGEAYSRRIVDSRVVDGPFQTTDELVERRVIPAATFAQIRDLITVQ